MNKSLAIFALSFLVVFLQGFSKVVADSNEYSPIESHEVNQHQTYGYIENIALWGIGSALTLGIVESLRNRRDN